MAILDPLIMSANSVQPLTKISVVNKIINLSLRPIDFTFRFTHPTLFNFGLFFCISNISISVSFTIVADRFIRHYKSLVYHLFSPFLGSKYFFLSFVFLLLLRNTHYRSNVFSSVLVFFHVRYGNGK